MYGKRKSLIIGSRESLLAVRQSEIVMEYLAENCPGLHCELKTMKTTGDRIMGRLDQIGGKGLFVKELDQALRDKKIDLSVHSLKDMPMEISPDLPVVGFSPREDPRDVLVLPAGSAGTGSLPEKSPDLPVVGFSPGEDPRDVLVLPAESACAGLSSEKGLSGEKEPLVETEPSTGIKRSTGIKQSAGKKLSAGTRLSAEAGPASLNGLLLQLDLSKPVGTSSRRRVLQLQRLFSGICPGIRFESVRGNIQTRLRKLDEGQYSALILAAAGLHRLHMEDRISRYFEVDEIVPSAGQGILALQGRAGEDYAFLNGFSSGESAMEAEAERAFVRALGGGCSSPIAAHAALQDGAMTLRGYYYDDGSEKGISRSLTRRVSTAEECRRAGEELAALILAAE